MIWSLSPKGKAVSRPQSEDEQNRPPAAVLPTQAASAAAHFFACATHAPTLAPTSAEPSPASFAPYFDETGNAVIGEISLQPRDLFRSTRDEQVARSRPHSRMPCAHSTRPPSRSLPGRRSAASLALIVAAMVSRPNSTETAKLGPGSAVFACVSMATLGMTDFVCSSRTQRNVGTTLLKSTLRAVLGAVR